MVKFVLLSSFRSNCDFSAANILRKHYTRPYFLPKLSESSKTDWMFMGSPGYGANLHVSSLHLVLIGRVYLSIGQYA